MPRHIHVHLHDAATGIKRPPSSVIKPTPNAPHNPPKNTSGIKPVKASAGVIKSAPHAAVKGVHLLTKGVEGLNKAIRKTGEISESKI